MTCTKAQVVLLLSYVIELIGKSSSLDEALVKVKMLKADLEEEAVEDFLRDLSR